jgi:hypothetical protein
MISLDEKDRRRIERILASWPFIVLRDLDAKGILRVWGTVTKMDRDEFGAHRLVQKSWIS